MRADLLTDLFDLATLTVESHSIASDFYRILLSHAVFLQAVSIDEVLMEVKLPDPSSSSQDAALEFAHQLRAEILAATGCEASIGVGHNILLARLASRRAKPASAFHLTPSLIDEFLAPLPVKSLPGIGWSNERKLEELGVTTVGDIRNTRLSELGRAIGETMAKKFHAFSRGVDARELDVGKARKSVSAEVNYGIRFNEQSEVEVSRTCSFAVETERLTTSPSLALRARARGRDGTSLARRGALRSPSHPQGDGPSSRCTG